MKIVRRMAVVVDVDNVLVVVIIQANARGRHFENGVVELREVAVDALGVAEVERGHVDGGRDGRVGGGLRNEAIGLVARSRDEAVAGGLEFVEDVSERNGAVFGPELEIVEAVKLSVVVVVSAAIGDVDGHDAVAMAVVAATIFAAVQGDGLGTGESGRRQVDLS